MNKYLNEFAEIVSSLNYKTVVIEFGAMVIPGQENYKPIRGMFRDYVGADYRKGSNVDIVLDLHKIALPDKSIGTILCLDTLEHVENPVVAVNEMSRVLMDDGMLVISSVFDFPIHNYPSDYWRFTPEGFRSLLKQFRFVYVFSIGEEDNPIYIYGIGSGYPIDISRINSFISRHNKKLKIQRFIHYIIPRFAVDLYLKIKYAL